MGKQLNAKVGVRSEGNTAYFDEEVPVVQAAVPETTASCELEGYFMCHGMQRFRDAAYGLASLPAKRRRAMRRQLMLAMDPLQGAFFDEYHGALIAEIVLAIS